MDTIIDTSDFRARYATQLCHSYSIYCNYLV